ncbi:hypothetical protein AYO22_04445 [Fonsecaea multimorphosa]|nr:hypothetical protein AYO22_04445 [Fonsecaea multimorphosa]
MGAETPKLQYLQGFGSSHSSEAIPGALPRGRNNPQKPPYGLVCEKVSGTAFTAPRKENQQTYLYRILPAVVHDRWTPYHRAYAPNDSSRSGSSENSSNLLGTETSLIPDQIRWSPFEIEDGNDFVTGMRLVCSAGSPESKSGLAIYIYTSTQSMPERQCFYSADGDMLVVPQRGTLSIQTELGKLLVEPTEIVVVPRGIRFRVENGLNGDDHLRGYILEIFGPNHFQLPELGVVGSSGCANPRDFQIPVAAFDTSSVTEWEVIAKYAQRLFVIRQNHTPFDVVGWHRTYYPYKYDLKLFNAVNSVTYDHLDPSVFTVLTCQSAIHGTAIADFAAVPPHMWVVTEDTYRPPWYHRNIMSEFVGLIQGQLEGKSGQAFAPGGASLHSVMSGHGPDAGAHKTATEAELNPVRTGANITFMFESSLFLGVSMWALDTCGKIQADYNSHWEAIKPNFALPG